LSPLDWHQMLHVNYQDIYRNCDNFACNNRNMHKKPYRTSLLLGLSKCDKFLIVFLEELGPPHQGSLVGGVGDCRLDSFPH